MEIVNLIINVKITLVLIKRIGTKLLVKNANYFRDGRVVVESVGVGRFKGTF